VSIAEGQAEDRFRCSVQVSTAEDVKAGQLSAEGWVFSAQDVKIAAIRAIAYGRTWPGEYGLPRPDVELAFPAAKEALRSGFRISLPSLSPSGQLRLEARIAGNWQIFFTTGHAPGARLRWLDYAQARFRGLFNRSSGHPRVRYEGLDQGYVCWIDQPDDWRRVSSRFRVSGWCFSKEGKPLEGIRVCIGSQCFAGQQGLSRPDVVAFYGARPGAFKSGFEVAVQAARGGVSLLRLEARHSDGLWKEVFRKRIGVSSLNLGRPRAFPSATDYQTWIKRYETVGWGDRSRIQKQIRSFRQQPRFSILMTLSDPDAKHLAAALQSVRRQIYPYWELCIALSAPSAQEVRRVIARYTSLDRRIKLCEGREGGDAVNEALAIARGDFVTLLNGNDRLASTALYFVAREINEHPEIQLIYSDEDKLDTQGRRADPHFKPDWNWTLFLGQNYVSHLSVLRGDLIKSLGFRGNFGGSQQYDLLLRCADSISPGQIRHIPRVLYHRRTPEKTIESDSATRAVQEHLERTGIAAEVTARPDKGYRRVRYLIPEVRPSVSIVIPTRDMIQLLRPCLESILEKTAYTPFEIVLVDNGSREATALDYLAEVSRDPRVRLFRRDEEFNYSRLNNFGVRKSEANFVALVNNDIRVISSEWLEEMISQATQPGIGAVSPRLLYPDGRVQQAGVILGAGLHGVAEVAHRGLPKGDEGYFGRAALAQELSAVGAACLLVRRSAYLEVGGFDERNLKVAFNDIDFCLKLLERGYRIIYTPYVELYHLEHASRGFENTTSKHQRFSEEIEHMKEKWKHRLLSDPAYNPNLSLGRELFTLSFPPRVTKPWR
jgi:GT2 family glycosyltransferase